MDGVTKLSRLELAREIQSGLPPGGGAATIRGIAADGSLESEERPLFRRGANATAFGKDSREGELLAENATKRWEPSQSEKQVRVAGAHDPRGIVQHGSMGTSPVA